MVGSTTKPPAPARREPLPRVATPTAVPDPSYASPAWLVDGHGVTPGVLTLRAARLAFVGDAGVVFDEPLVPGSSIAFRRPHRAGRLEVVVDGRRRRLRLTRPRHASAPCRHVARVAGLELPAGPIGNPTEGRRAGRVWRTLLATSRG